MRLKLCAVLITTTFLVACNSDIGKAQKIADNLRCTMPEGVLRFQPLLNIGQNAQKETLARELIELQRRQPMSKNNWQLASTFVYLDQSELARMPNIMQGDVDFIETTIKNTQRGYLKIDVLEMAQQREKLYKEECEKYIEANKAIAAKLEQLVELQSEKNQDWLDPKKKLPCGIQESKGCYK